MAQEMNAKEPNKGDEALEAMNGLWLAGSPEKHVYNGVDMQALPTLRLQAARLGSWT